MKIRLLSSIAAAALLASAGSAYAMPSEAGAGDQETGPGNQELVLATKKVAKVTRILTATMTTTQTIL